MPLTEAAGSDTGIWPTSSLVIWPPTWLSVNLVQWEWRQVISFPRMEPTWQRIFCFLIVTTWWTWWDNIKGTSLVRWWGHWSYLSHASMIAGSSASRNDGCAHGCWIAWLLLLIVCLKSLDSITGSSITARVRRNHWRTHWTPWSTTRTVTNKEWWMHKRSWSWYIRAGPCRPLSARQNRRLIRCSNTAAGRREGRGMVLPTVIMRIHGRKSIGSWHLTRYWWAPVII